MSGKIKIYLAFLIIVVSLILFQVKNPHLTGPYKGLIGNLLNPVAYIIHNISSGISNFYRGYIDLRNVKMENSLLAEKIKQYEIQINVLNEKLSNYERLKSLLNFKEAFDFTTVACNVIGRNMRSNSFYILIDRGSSDGIHVNDAVIGLGGLVGKVDDVYVNSSIVKVIIDFTSNAGVLNTNTRSMGIAKGNGNGLIYVDFYDKLDPVKQGDIFVTSGIGKVFPKGIPVGTVKNIEESENGLFQKVILAPFVDFYKIENVMVVKFDKK